MENHSNINNMFIPYELALKLKELCFDEECFGAWKNNKKTPMKGYFENQIMSSLDNAILAPLWQQAFDWFREKGFSFGVDKIHNETDLCHFHVNYNWEYFQGTYQEARQACLEELIEFVELLATKKDSI